MEKRPRAATGHGFRKIYHQWDNKFCASVCHRRLPLLTRHLTHFFTDCLEQARLLRITPPHHKLSWTARLYPARLLGVGVAGDRSAGVLRVPFPLMINELASTRPGCVWAKSRNRLRRSSKLSFTAQES
jgi:hypothetical protein